MCLGKAAGTSAVLCIKSKKSPKEIDVEMLRNQLMIFGMAFLTGLLFMSGCDNRLTQEAGFLEGVISIGPICPVQRNPPDPGCQPTAETYKAYPVNVYSSDGTRKIAQINHALDGSFRTELTPGNYLVILEKEQNKIGSSNLPVEVSIISMEKTLLNINIDTGIR